MGRRSLVILVVVLTLLFAGCATHEGRFTLVNGSGVEISSARIEVCGQVSEFRDIAAGGEAAGTFAVRGDSGYDVSITFASGDELNREVGYVTSGLDYEDTITVTQSSIEITGSPQPALD